MPERVTLTTEEKLAQRDREVAARALREAADAWTQGAWADTPRYAERAQDRIAAANYVGQWLRARADRVMAGEAGQEAAE